MELKLSLFKKESSSFRVLIVPFMELKRSPLLSVSLLRIVLIVPFMELKLLLCL